MGHTSSAKKQKILHQPFDLFISDMEAWNERPLVYHFFEIVQILEGSGMREVNNNRFSYHKGSIFLFTPLDCRGFDSATPTRFCSIRFSEVFLGKSKNTQERERIGLWLQQLEHIFYHHNRFQELLFRQPGDCQMISGILENMVKEYENKQSYHEENLQHFVTLILNILARNVSDNTNISDSPAGRPSTSTGEESEPLINRMLVHIRRHIGNPGKLRIGYLASQFNLAPNYVGEYFRKFTGESLQQYITQYKLKLVQQRLANSTLSISQIADELGFTDESHLSRQFRKHHGKSPVEYRKKAKPVS
ncbi:AraC family transcriptional regulator [Flavitalea flava]